MRQHDPSGAPRGPLRGLPPIARSDAVALVLGSMPGTASLEAQRYYAHPYNAFWKVFGALVGASPELDYAQRTEALLRARIAVWDVVQSCERLGSLDSAIRRASVVPNDFDAFVAAHPQLRLVVCNGATARSFFARYVVPHASDAVRALRVVLAPSTSPAHAAMTLPDKIAAWRQALAGVVECAAP
jgi:hypoxanthine-DNA glycosylase